jgi:hypothetical protein
MCKPLGSLPNITKMKRTKGRKEGNKNDRKKKGKER